MTLYIGRAHDQAGNLITDTGGYYDLRQCQQLAILELGSRYPDAKITIVATTPKGEDTTTTICTWNRHNPLVPWSYSSPKHREIAEKS
jgi:hypothetical protein